MNDEQIYLLTIIHYNPEITRFTEDKQVYQGTFEQLKEYFNEYILDGFVKSSEKGNKKINTEPKNMKELCSSIKKSSYNLNQFGLMDSVKYEKFIK